jgi:hypothetical protein
MKRATRWLKTNMRVEFTLGLLLLLAVGLLTGVPLISHIITRKTQTTSIPSIDMRLNEQISTEQWN